MQNVYNSECLILTADASGHAAAALPLTEADLGRTLTYRLYEINDGRKNVTYSRKVYEICITPVLTPDNRIAASVTVDGTAVEQIAVAFENIYSADDSVPLTGDSAHPAAYAVLMLMSALGMALLTPAVRRRHSA